MVAALAPHEFRMFVTCSELDVAKSIVWHFLEVSAGAREEEKWGGCAGGAGKIRKGRKQKQNRKKLSHIPFRVFKCFSSLKLYKPSNSLNFQLGNLAQHQVISRVKNYLLLDRGTAKAGTARSHRVLRQRPYALAGTSDAL